MPSLSPIKYHTGAEVEEHASESLRISPVHRGFSLLALRRLGLEERGAGGLFALLPELQPVDLDV